MKKRAILFMSLLAISSLAGCTHEAEPSYETCSITFHQAYDGFEQDDVFTYTIGKTTYLEVKAFQDEIVISKRRGYDVSWDEFDLSEITEDYVVNALYTLHKYQITYVYESRTLGTTSYTIESTDEEIKTKEPDLPTTAGYTYYYENYSVIDKAENFIVRASRDLITYHAKFVDIEGNPIEGFDNIPFNVTTESIEEPAVPAINGKDGKWEHYELSASDIIIHPEYSDHYYHAYFWNKEGEDKKLVADIPFTINDTMIQEPGVPLSDDYRDGVWKDYSLGEEDIDVYPIYGDYHAFKIDFKKKADDRTPIAGLSKTFTYVTNEQTLPDGYRDGYHSTWKYENIEYEGGDSFELEMHDYTFLLKKETAHSYTVTLNPGKGSIDGETTIEVTYGQPYELEVPGYDYGTFDGWYTEGGQKIPNSGNWSIAEDVSATARYNNTQYYIYYKETAESEEYLVDPIPFDVDSLNQIVLEGAQYGYHSTWLLDDEEYEGGTQITLGNHDYTFILKPDSTTPHKHTITLIPGVGTVEGGTEMEVFFGEAYSINPATPNYKYCDFLGWFNEDEEVPMSGNWNIDEDVVAEAHYSEGLSFEREDVYDFITIKQNVSSLTITDEDATKGNKSLKIVSAGGDYGVYFSKQYLDDIFADEDVVAINFDAKASVASNNFRAKIAGVNTTYEQNDKKYGLTTEWKKFSFRRSYYEAYVTGDAMIYGGNNDAKTFVAGEYVLVDNVVPVTEELDSFGFENGYYNGATTYYSSGHSNSQPAPAQIFSLSSTPVASGFDYEIKSEGNRSFTFTKNNGYLALNLSSAIKNSLDENDYITFDLYFVLNVPGNPSLNSIRSDNDVRNLGYGVNDSNGKPIQFGQTTPFAFQGGQWNTLTVPYSGINASGRFVQINGSSAGQFYIDNIKLVIVD